jgi:hypothetical protein
MTGAGHAEIAEERVDVAGLVAAAELQQANALAAGRPGWEPVQARHLGRRERRDGRAQSLHWLTITLSESVTRQVPPFCYWLPEHLRRVRKRRSIGAPTEPDGDRDHLRGLRRASPPRPGDRPSLGPRDLSMSSRNNSHVLAFLALVGLCQSVRAAQGMSRVVISSVLSPAWLSTVLPGTAAVLSR